MRQRTAWLSLDQGDDEPTRFWSYALTSLCRVAPEVGARALATLSAPGVEPTVTTLPVLLNDLAASGTELEQQNEELREREKGKTELVRRVAAEVRSVPTTCAE